MAENYYGLTDTGKVRDNNEDAFIAQQGLGSIVLAAVIDGVGGYNGGEVAAAIAKEVLTDELSTVKGNLIPAMIEAFKLANKKIVDKKTEDRELESMACVATMALVDVANNKFCYAHVGDTRLYLLRDGSLVKISKDHSFVGFLEDSGRITESAAMNHPKRNEINKALGFTTQIDTDDTFIETGESPFLPGDILLICSDGLTDMIDKVTILSIITSENSLKQKSADLIEAANKNGGNDNVTVVLVSNDKEAVKPTIPITPASEVKKKPQHDNVIISDRHTADDLTQPEKPMAQSKSNGLTILLGILCLVFLATSIWLYLNSHKAKTTAVATDTATQKLRNDAEVKLQDAIDEAKGDTLVLSDSAFKQPVIISDTLHIDQDTLYIKIKGNVTLKRDTAYHGPALLIGRDSRKIVIDNLKFDDFDIAVQASNSALGFVNTTFNNCRLPVQRNVVFAGKPVTSFLPGIGLAKDTVKIKKPNGAR